MATDIRIDHGVKATTPTASPKLSAERLSSARRFFLAFNNPVARAFFTRAHAEQTPFAVLAHHPKSQNIDRAVLARNCQILFETIQRRLAAIADKPEQLFEVIKSLGRDATPQDSMWFLEYGEAHLAYRYKNKPLIRARALAPYISGDSVVDIGCGGGGLIVAIRELFKSRLRQVAGIDISDDRPAAVKRLFRELDINFQQVDFSQPDARLPEQYATGMLMTMLHHVGTSDREIGRFLTGIKTAVTQRLIVEEDAIITPDDIRQGSVAASEISSLRESQPLLDEYLRFDYQTQKDILFITCLITNSLTHGVPTMPFPGGFRSVGEWARIFRANGFEVKKVEVPGFEQTYFVQRCPVVFVLDRTA